MKPFEARLTKSLKTLKENEVEQALQFLESLPPEKAELLADVGDAYLRSSTLNATWFWRLLPLLGRQLPPDAFEKWLNEGQAICRGNWEVSLAFLRGSLEAAGFPKLFNGWITLGRELNRYSSEEAAWFFKHSIYILNKFSVSERIYLLSWLEKLLSLSWRSVNACLSTWQELIDTTTTTEREKLLTTGCKIAVDLGQHVQQYFLSLPELIKILNVDFIGTWIQGARSLGSGNPAILTAYFKHSTRLAAIAGQSSFADKLITWVTLGKDVANVDPVLAEMFFSYTAQVLTGLKWSQLQSWVEQIIIIAKKESTTAARDFIGATPELTRFLKIKEIETWVQVGLNKTTPRHRKTYFQLKSQESRDTVTSLRSGLFFESVKKVLSFYYEGLTGVELRLRNASDLPESIRGRNQLYSTLDTRRIYLPEVIRVFEEEADNNRLYRAMLMHQAAHREFGTLDLRLGVLDRLRKNPFLAKVFEYLEDIRVDYLTGQKYPGAAVEFSYLINFTGLQRETEGSPRGIFGYLKNYPEVKEDQVSYSLPEKVKQVVDRFWQTLLNQGSTVELSLITAEAITRLYEGDQQLNKGDAKLNKNTGYNLIYRGGLDFDLLYASKVIDIEADSSRESMEELSSLQPKHDQSGFSLKAYEFTKKLKALLEKFLEEEENPYRLVAFYDEWDKTINDYKKDWCTVREILLKPSSGRFVDQALRENYGMIVTLKRYFGMLRPDRLRRYRRQEDGEEIDIDSVIEAQVDIQAGVSSTGGFYIRRDKRDRDVAVAFLLDMSYSTEEKIFGTTKSLLDVEKESVIVMAEALEILGDKYAIYGFNSDSREKISFYVAKDFDESYSTEVKQRFGGLQSYGMTRVAAALRHAVYKLERVNAAVRILILLSDGRPFDFDYNSGLNEDYQAYYPETDTRMALQEAKMKGINPFCITVDQQGYEYLEYIYGPVNYIVINQVEELPAKLTETYRNLTT